MSTFSDRADIELRECQRWFQWLPMMFAERVNAANLTTTPPELRERSIRRFELLSASKSSSASLEIHSEKVVIFMIFH